MICICCCEPMAPGTERPPSGGNPNQCVPCVCGIKLPAQGCAAYRPTDGPINLPPVTAPAGSVLRTPNRDGGIGDDSAGGNPFPRGRWS